MIYTLYNNTSIVCMLAAQIVALCILYHLAYCSLRSPLRVDLAAFQTPYRSHRVIY